MNKISNKEKEELEYWLDIDISNRQKFEQAKAIWELTGQSGKPLYDLEEEKQKVLTKIKDTQQTLASPTFRLE